jgi:hypothetical protein
MKKSERSRNHRIPAPGELGQSLIVFTMFLSAACGFAALVIDVGFVVQDKTALQAGVDAAALAGASGLPDPEEATSIAQDYAARNGIDPSDATLTVNTPYNGDPSKIEVTVTRTQDAFFAKVFGIDIFQVSARAVATRQGAGGDQAAILALNPTKCSSFNKVGSSTIAINNNGGIMVNSSCDPSIGVNGGGTVSAAVINYYAPGGFNQSGSQLSPTPTAAQEPLPDPLKDVPPPSLSILSLSLDSGGTPLTPAMKTVSSGTVTLRPGIYYGGLTIKSSAIVTLQPGVYVMAGGGFTVQGGPTINGSEVMIYSTYDPQKPTGAGACGAIDLSGTGVWNYSPPSSGVYKGIGLWQDKACTNDVRLNGSNGGPSGAIYAPTARINMAGSGSIGSIQLIADSFDVSGSGNMSVDFVPYISIPMSLAARLVE